VVDGRPEFLRGLAEAPDNIRNDIASEMRALLDTRAFIDTLPGFPLPDSARQGRASLSIERLNALAQSAA
jgi:hypothetical protein